MKYNNVILLSSFLISSFGCTNGQENPGFLDVMGNLTAGSRVRRSNLHKVIADLDLESGNLTAQEEDLDNKLTETSEVYNKLERVLGDLCYFNDLDVEHDRSLTRPRLILDHPNLLENFKRLMAHQINYLKAAVNHTLPRVVIAQEYVDQVYEKLTSVSGILIQIQEKLKLLGHKLEALKVGNNSHIKRCRADMGILTAKFLKDSEDYVNWFKGNLSELKSLAGADSEIIRTFKSIAEEAQQLIDEVGNLLDEKLEKLSKEEIDALSNKIPSIVKKLSVVCRH